ncbi:putative signal peptide protein [Puccinia sorghi]|uniref:Putative signal peptide protein n=1 Tax=Puccinia sorghi TaxID=27349 RepID=A0A0L6UUD5_9BASI|nr:putative signal peptide protein [Puccinia sorghi]
MFYGGFLGVELFLCYTCYRMATCTHCLPFWGGEMKPSGNYQLGIIC